MKFYHHSSHLWLLGLLCSLIFNQCAFQSPPKLVAYSSLVADLNTKTIKQAQTWNVKSPSKPFYPLLIASIAIGSSRLHQKIQVTAADLEVKNPQLGLKVGESYSIKSLVEALLFTQAPEAENLVFRGVAGNKTTFESLLKNKLRRLQLKPTLFSSNQQPSSQAEISVKDLLTISQDAFNYHLVRKILSLKQWTWIRADGSSKVFKHNFPDFSEKLSEFARFQPLQINGVHSQIVYLRNGIQSYIIIILENSKDDKNLRKLYKYLF